MYRSRGKIGRKRQKKRKARKEKTNLQPPKRWLYILGVFTIKLGEKWSCARGPPQFLKKRSENAGANENLSCGCPSILRIAPGVAPRIVGFVLLKSWDAIPRMNFAFRESVSEFRELLREYPGTLRELREWPVHSESVFPEIGVVPRLLKWDFWLKAAHQLRCAP